MADDILTRLRNVTLEDYRYGGTLKSDAANEIERLRKENDDLREISRGWWLFHIGKITPEEMQGLLLKVDNMAKQPIPGIYD